MDGILYHHMAHYGMQGGRRLVPEPAFRKAELLSFELKHVD